MLTPAMVHNHDDVYEGDLVHYTNVVLNAPNVLHGYHNIDHMLYVTAQLYDAIGFYQFDPRIARNLLIAGLFHDYDHSGSRDPDHHNIARALKGLKIHIISQDRQYYHEIAAIIQATEFPHKDPGALPADRLLVDIIRDADLTQCLSQVRIKDILFGLQQERGKNYKIGIQDQVSFLKRLRFKTQRAQQKFGLKLTQRIQEVEQRHTIIHSHNHVKNQ